MLKFLSQWRGAQAAPDETQRARFERLIGELNEMIAAMPERPDITVAGQTGQIAVTAPKQFADEALALPKPGDDAESEAEKKAA